MKIFVAFFVFSSLAFGSFAMPSRSMPEMPEMPDMPDMPEMSPMPITPAMSPSPSMDMGDNSDMMDSGDDKVGMKHGKHSKSGMMEGEKKKSGMMHGENKKPAMVDATPSATGMMDPSPNMMSMPDMPEMSLPSASPFRKCRGNATYTLTFINLLTPFRFGSKIPPAGLVYSPPIGVSHSNRVSLLTVRGFATPEVEEIAETGNNEPLANLSRSLISKGYVLNVSTATGPTMPGYSSTLKVTVDCERPFVTMLGMIAPSPDWIVQVSNRNMFSESLGRFSSGSAGPLIAYDAGVDNGRDFTDPADTSLDMPTKPAKNIAPLVEDDTDRFGGRVVGWYKFIRVM